MSNIWRMSNPTAQRNVNFIQRGFADVLKGDGDKAAQTPDKKEIVRKEEDASGGQTQRFSTDVSVQGPKSPPKDPGSPPDHHE